MRLAIGNTAHQHGVERQQAIEQRAGFLVSTYADTILRLAYTYLHSTCDAEDACQEVLIKALKRARPFASSQHEHAWILRVTATTCKDMLRRQRVRQTVPLDEAPEPADPHPTIPSSLENSPASAAVRDAYVLQAVMSLPVTYREAIHLHYYENLSLRDMARVLGCTEMAAAARLSRARKQLRTLLKGLAHEED